ncbi:ABC transporter substrate-binding protein [Sphingomonas jatrophae]|uniref:Sulfonate transport system substrate-binding protein n=1 Tax=Sphingomonas jatrophae TaxID=1166337 RepID=A0A1I6K9Z2_9SPHN|nr:ABC transporter substrate-binding protein [Sphingomonas jatrophae]SFR88042.1 sulfonate transport system substrate-binding protein [Sphingomonas jatrophae]
MKLTRRNAVLALAALLAACSGGGAGEQPKIVRIIAGGSTVHGKYVPGNLTGVVESEGWLKQQLASRGYALEFVDMPHAIGGPMINEGFANKSLEFASYGDLPAVIGAAGGSPIRLVLSQTGVFNSYLLVPTGSPARSIADLKGKRLALHRGRPWECALARAAEAAGLTINDFKVINVNPSAGAAALAAGKVDAFVGPVADADRLQREGAGRILWSTKQAPAAWAARTEIWGRKDFVADHPELATLVAAAYLHAGKWASADGNRDAYIKRLSLETPESAIRADLADAGPWKARFAPLDPAVLKDHYRYIIDYAAKTGLIGDKPSFEDLTDTGLTANALKLADAEGFWSAPPTTPAQ